MNTVDFGKFITELRKEKGFTQKQLADKLDITDKAVSRWETGKNYPDIEMFEKLSEVFGVTVSELLESRRIPRDELADVSSVQVVSQIKSNKRSRRKYRIVIVTVIILAMFAVYFGLSESGVLSGVIYKHIDCYSNDVLTILNNVDGYISQRPKSEGDYIINNGWIFIKPNKTTHDLYLSGTCENGRYFYVNTLYDENNNENSYCFIGEMRKNQEPTEGISINDLKSLVAQLDLSIYETKDKYQIMIHDVGNYESQDLYLNEYQASKKKYIFTDGILQEYSERALTGEYLLVQLMVCEGGTGEKVADIFCVM